MKLFEINHMVNPEQAAEVIITHCKPFLQEINYQALENRLYRGSGTARDYMKVDPYTGLRLMPGHIPNRKPKDTLKAVHNSVNKLFVKTFGLPFRDGVFVSGDPVYAKDYGKLMLIVIPVGSFKYLWSPEITDMYASWLSYFGHDWDDWNEQYKRSSNEARKEMKTTYNKEFASLLLRGANYQTSNLIQGIQSKNEIMLYSDQCIVLRSKFDQPLEVLQYIQQKGLQQ